MNTNEMRSGCRKPSRFEREFDKANSQDAKSELSQRPEVRSSRLLDALERAVGEEAHFYKFELEEGYGVSMMRGPRFKGQSMKAVLEQLAQHYGI